MKRCQQIKDSKNDIGTPIEFTGTRVSKDVVQTIWNSIESSVPLPNIAVIKVSKDEFMKLVKRILEDLFDLGFGEEVISRTRCDLEGSNGFCLPYWTQSIGY